MLSKKLAGQLRRCGAGCVLFTLLAPSGIFAQGSQSAQLPSRYETYPNYSTGNTIAQRLRQQPAQLFEFDRASLRDVLRLLADDAGIPFVAMQDSEAVENTLVTFTLRTSPFRALEVISQANGVALFYENGVWFMRPFNDRELIARTYRLKYSPQDNISYQSGGSQSGATTSLGSGGSGSAMPDLNINLQGATDVFQVKPPNILEEIQKLLGIPSTGYNAQIAPDTSVTNPLPLQVTPQVSDGSGNPPPGGVPTGDNGAQVIFNSSVNSLYVLATRQQHQWVESLLNTVDQPQPLIGIEIKFFETTRDPSKELGVNWANTMAGGYNIRLEQEVAATGGIGFDVDNRSDRMDDSARESFRNSQFLTGTPSGGGTPFNFSEGFNRMGSEVLDAYNSLRSYNAGMGATYTAVLRPRAVDFAIQAFMQDKDTSIVQYPRVLTINNKEVVIRSVINEPVLAATSSVTPGFGGTTASSVSYLPIGTIINVLPKQMPDNSVMLNVAITVSSIVSFVEINDGAGLANRYPRAASRVYNAALQVDSGYTLAVGGIEEASDMEDRNGIPFLQDIPLAGNLFKSKSRAQRKRNLIIFITPTVIEDRKSSSGITEAPQTTLPIDPNEPQPPAFTPTGRLVGGMDSLPETIQWLDRQVAYYRQINDEFRTDKETQKSLRSVTNTAQMVQGEIERFEQEHPDQMMTLSEREAEILEIIRDLGVIQSQGRRNIIY